MDSDVEFILADGETVRAHRALLAIKSPVFKYDFLFSSRSYFNRFNKRGLFDGNLKKQTIRLDEIQDSKIFIQFLLFLYTHDSGDLTNLLASQLLPLAQTYQVNHLQLVCQEILGVQKKPEEAEKDKFPENVIRQLIEMGMKRG